VQAQSTTWALCFDVRGVCVAFRKQTFWLERGLGAPVTVTLGFLDLCIATAWGDRLGFADRRCSCCKLRFGLPEAPSLHALLRLDRLEGI
jgi:hypothetical protein